MKSVGSSAQFYLARRARNFKELWWKVSHNSYHKSGFWVTFWVTEPQDDLGGNHGKAIQEERQNVIENNKLGRLDCTVAATLTRAALSANIDYKPQVVVEMYCDILRLIREGGGAIELPSRK
jgi:hypothetical protein